MKKFLIAIIFASLTLTGCNNDTETTEIMDSGSTDATIDVSVTPENSTRTYRSKNLQVCERIRYVCDKNKQPFSDETGCGCE